MRGEALLGFDYSQFHIYEKEISPTTARQSALENVAIFLKNYTTKVYRPCKRDEVSSLKFSVILFIKKRSFLGL